MKVHEYAPLARRTLKVMPDFRQHMVHMGLGISGEMGEVIDAVKKVCVYGKPHDHTNATEEVGDDLWYIVNLLPELEVEPVYIQRALERGYAHGLSLQQKQDIWSDCNLGDMLLALNKEMADKCAELPRLSPTVAGTSVAVSYIEHFAGNLGVLCGLLGVDPEHAMQVNIEKLAKRYGDKYSDMAALNRDLAAERRVLEGGSVPVVHTTFDELVAHGRDVLARRGFAPPTFDFLPRSFDFYGWLVMYKSDDEYAVGPVYFRRGQLLVTQGANVTPYVLDTTHPGGNLGDIIGKPLSNEHLAAVNGGKIDLASDAPLAGGTCSTDGPCEGCQ